MNENAKARYNEMLQSAEQYREAQKFETKRTFNFPKLSNLFTGRKSQKQTAVAHQAR